MSSGTFYPGAGGDDALWGCGRLLAFVPRDDLVPEDCAKEGRYLEGGRGQATGRRNHARRERTNHTRRRHQLRKVGRQSVTWLDDTVQLRAQVYNISEKERPVVTIKFRPNEFIH